MGAVVEDIEYFISSFMKDLNIKDYKMDITGNSEKGDGYLGEISFITVCTDKKTYDLVIKSAKKLKELRELTPLHEIYLRENFMYTKVFPIFKELQIQKGLKPFDNLAKCFFALNEELRECLVLQNLKVKGFDLHDRKKPMNLHHLLMVLKTYGRYHALSYALRDKNPSVFHSVSKNMTNLLARMLDEPKILDNHSSSFKSSIRLLGDEHPELYKKLQTIENDVETSLKYDFDLDDPAMVIVQGDCWNNNFLFKYEHDATRTKPSDVVFLDFQASRVASPVIDLSYFIYATASKETLEQFDVLLEVYYQSLKEFSALLGTDIDEFLPFEKLKQHWQNYSKFGLFVCAFLLKFVIMDKEEVPDFGDILNEDGISDESKNVGLYNTRIKDVLKHYAERYL